MIERSTVGSLLRCTQAYCQQICGKETLQYGIAYYAPRFPFLSDANQFREITVRDRAGVLSAVEEGLAWFTARNLHCHVFAPAVNQPADDFAVALAPHGFVPKRFAALRLTRWVDGEAAGIRVLPARAMRAALRETFLQDPAMPAPLREASADAFMERLDDAALDAFVAVVDGRPVGRGSLHQVGDLAQLVDFSALPTDAASAVERALVHQTLGIARRLAIKHILTQVDAAQTERILRLESVGFERDGEIVEFHAGGASIPGDGP